MKKERERMKLKKVFEEVIALKSKVSNSGNSFFASFNLLSE